MEPHGNNSSDVPDGTATAADQRSATRFEYEYVQGISPLRGEMSDTDDILDIVCHDISQGGFSFFLESEPDFEELVAVLGRRPETVRVRARVVRAKPIECDGAPRYLVGCTFTERLDGVA